MKTLPLILALTALTATTRPVSAQRLDTTPFIRNGEVLTFNVHSSRFGNIGTATMRVESDTVDNRAAIRLSFDFKGRIMLFSVTDHTRSWLDPNTLSTMRYTKTEHSPLSTRQEHVDIDAVAATWTDAAGPHALAATDPLDELAFIYSMRQLSAAGDSLPASIEIGRHFDKARNPVHVNVLVPAQVVALGTTQQARVLEMVVKDTRQKSGTTKMTFYISADAAHLPLRIDSSMPVGGTMSLTLKSVTVSPTLARTK